MDKDYTIELDNTQEIELFKGVNRRFYEGGDNKTIDLDEIKNEPKRWIVSVYLDKRPNLFRRLIFKLLGLTIENG